jgi:hypothetical protein
VIGGFFFLGREATAKQILGSNAYDYTVEYIFSDMYNGGEP